MSHVSTCFYCLGRRKIIHVTHFIVPKVVSDIGRISVIMRTQYQIFIFVINNEETDSLYFSKNICRLTSLRKIAYSLSYRKHEEDYLNAYKILDGKCERYNLGEVGIILNLSLEIGCKCVHRISVAYSRDQWRTLINKVRKFPSFFYC